MIPANKVFLTPDQEAYLRKNYATIINRTICKELGISDRTLHRIAREKGLKKDMQAIEGQRRKQISISVRRALKSQGKGNHGNGMATRFAPGFRPKERFGEAKFMNAHRIAIETRKRNFAEEKARVMCGLPPRTKMRVIAQPRKKIMDRCYLKRRGYILDEKNLIAYWTPETRRATKLEAMPRRYYIFKPYEP